MTNDIDGGPAFPQEDVTRENVSRPVPHISYQPHQISLRDWFAGQALTGLLSGQYNHISFANLREVPDEAYRIADAMIYARKEQSHD